MRYINFYYHLCFSSFDFQYIFVIWPYVLARHFVFFWYNMLQLLKINNEVKCFHINKHTWNIEELLLTEIQKLRKPGERIHGDTILCQR